VRRALRQGAPVAVLASLAAFVCACGSSATTGPSHSVTAVANLQGHGAPRGPALITEPRAGYGFVKDAVAAARSSVELAMYELSDRRIEAALASAAGRGVKVSVILDADREGWRNRPAYDYLSSRGVHVAWGPASTIVHQKTLCVDDVTCWVMTGNLTPVYYATTRDYAVVDSDPADVAAIVATFRSDFGAGRLSKPTPGPGLIWAPGAQGALVALIASARSRLQIEAEVMNSRAVSAALEAAARRGVHVLITMTDQSEWASAFNQLSSAGVHIATYPDTATALYIHAKVIVVDGRRAFVGSENFSDSSLYYTRELGVVTSEPAVVAPLAARLTRDFSGGTPWRR
jgi:phosphatidylserine/phosphatidylglycerophosphate/cardiolipin synthase-like enzyme